MNLPAFSQPDDLQQLDRLVDGELSEPERRELLSRFDREPDGWRRLALAFLEAQSWQESARDRDAADSKSPVMLKPTAPPSFHARQKSKLSRLGAPLAMAASFLVAFTLGLALRETWKSPNN